MLFSFPSSLLTSYYNTLPKQMNMIPNPRMPGGGGMPMPGPGGVGQGVVLGRQGGPAQMAMARGPPPMYGMTTSAASGPGMMPGGGGPVAGPGGMVGSPAMSTVAGGMGMGHSPAYVNSPMAQVRRRESTTVLYWTFMFAAFVPQFFSCESQD